MMDADALPDLNTGLGLLTDIIQNEGQREFHTLAGDIGSTHVSMLVSAITKRLEAKTSTEPELESMFHVIVDIQGYDFGDTEKLSKAKVKTAGQLCKSNYQGYSKEEMRCDLRELM